MSNHMKSEEFFAEAGKHLVGGVNSPVRAYRDFDFAPPFISKAKGAHIWDVDGNEYIDYVASWGPMILGHAHSAVVEAIAEAAENGSSFGAPTEKETELAKLVKVAFPSIDLLRFVSSGTEATMSAIRAARGFTGRDKIIKFNGCYHGHSDYLLVKAGSGLASFGAPDSGGVPEDFARHTLIAEYNDLISVQTLVDKYPNEIATIIVEPIAGNMGCIKPNEGFLPGLRNICDQNGIVLIFDEVITGFRVAFGGAQEFYKIKPDLTCLGKILGGGLPMGGYGGRKDIMEKISPLGNVYQAGTLSGNPIAVSAGLAVLNLLKDKKVYELLEEKSAALTENMSKEFSEKGIPHSVSRVGSIFSFFFCEGRVNSYKDAERQDKTFFNKYFIHMLNNGVYLAPSSFESAFVGAAHSEQDFEQTLVTLRKL